MPLKLSDRMAPLVEQLEYEVSTWPNIRVGRHRFGGHEFVVGTAEVGHVHGDGTVDIPFTHSLRNALLAEGLVEEHLHVPNSGWATFRIRSAEDVAHAARLMRLSYLRYLLKNAANPAELVETEATRINLSSQLKTILHGMIVNASQPS